MDIFDDILDIDGDSILEASEETIGYVLLDEEIEIEETEIEEG